MFERQLRLLCVLR